MENEERHIPLKITQSELSKFCKLAQAEILKELIEDIDREIDFYTPETLKIVKLIKLKIRRNT